MYQFRNIKSRLTFWFFIISILPMIAAEFTIYRHMENSRKAVITDKLKAIRDLKVEEVKKWIESRIGDVRTMASDPHIHDLENIHEGKEGDIRKNAAIVSLARDHLRNFLQNYNAFYEIYIINPHTQKIIVCTNETHEGEVREKETSLYEVFQEEGIFIKDIHYSGSEKKPDMSFYIPVYRSRNGSQAFGILVGRVNLEGSLYDLLLRRTGMGETGETLIVNRNAVVLNKLHLFNNAPLDLKINAVPAVEASRGNTGIAETHDYRGEMVLAAYTHIPRTGWGFVVKQDLEEIYAPVYQLRKWTMSTGLSAVLIVIIAAFRVSRSISEPIKRLQTGSEIIGSGNLDHRVGTDVQDEIGQLSRSFDHMTVQLKKSRSALEEEISERRKIEAALRKSESELLSMYDAITDSVTVISKDFRIISTNRVVENLFGKNIAGRVCYETYQGRNEVCPDCPAKQAIETKKAAFSFQPATDVSPPFEISAFPVLDEKGDVTAVVEYGKDITDRLKAENALKESEEKYRRFFTTIPSGWSYHKIVVDERDRPVDYVFLEVNDAFERLTGLKKEKIIGKRVTEVLPGTEKDPADWIGKYGEVALTGKSMKFDNYSEGIKKWFLVSASSPEKGYFITVFEDITESKTLEKKLQEGARLRQLFMDSLPCVALLLKRDTREIVASNRTAASIGAVPGKRCYETFGKSDRPCPWCLAPKVWATGETRHEQFWGLGIYWDAYWIPASDNLYLHYAFDITDRKRAEEKLQEEKEKLQKYLDISAVIVVMIDAAQRVTLINKKGCELLGYKEDEIVGKNWFDHFLPECSRDEIKQVHTRLMAGEIEPLEYYENDVLTRDGEKRSIAWYNTVFRDERSRITQTLGSGVDITERKKSDELIKKSLREKEVLMKEIHHRVKNNMAVISSLLKLQANKIEDEKYRAMFYDSMGRIKSMALLHEKLYRSQDFSRLDFSAYLKEVVMSVFTSYRLIPGKIALKMDIENVNLGIDTAIPCGLIVNELVSNALKHAFPEGRNGKLTVSLYLKDKAGVELIVGDNGVGVSGSIDFRKTASLGLNLVNTLVRQLQGTIELNSEQGTEFRITFQEA